MRKQNWIAWLLIATMTILMTACSDGDTQSVLTREIVIHVDSNDTGTQGIVLKNVTNLVKSYGEDNIKIEVVAYGPGLSLLMNGKPNSETVQAMAAEDYIRFSACNNTIQKIKSKTGKAPDLIDGVVVVPSGAARIIDLEKDGYVYIKP